MAVIVKTENPTALLGRVRAEIASENIVTWELKNGYLTHVPEQWRAKAWFLPKVLDGNLLFLIRPSKGRKVTSVVYAVYHGRLVEMLLAHFDSDFTEVNCTAMPDYGDSVGK